MMKKVLLILLAVGMLFTLVGCNNNDENNAAVQAKVDESEALVEEIYAWYDNEGFLEGEFEAEFKPAIDSYVQNIEEIKEAHQQVIDNGGYSDEDAAIVIEALDSDIVVYKEVLSQLE